MFRTTLARIKNIFVASIIALGFVVGAAAIPAQAATEGPVIELADSTADNKYVQGEFVEFVITDVDLVSSVTLTVTVAGRTLEFSDTPNLAVYEIGINTSGGAGKGVAEFVAIDSLGNSTEYTYSFNIKRK